jgi:hypothetical protein
MPDYRLRIGMKFRQQSRVYVIEQCLPEDHLGVRDALSNEYSARKRSELMAALFDGKLELLGDDDQSETLEAHLGSVRVTDLSQLDDDDPLRVEAIRRSQYVNHVLSDCSIK